MATVTVNSIIAKVQTILQDTVGGGVRWPRSELIGWLNDAYREISLARPDSNTSSGNFACDAGTRQKLTKAGGFPSAIRLVDVVRNVAATSTKSAIRPVDRRILDDQRRGWHSETQSVNVEHFMFDLKLPTEFLVYPPATSLAMIEVVYTSVPIAHDAALPVDSIEVIRIDDSYANALLDLTLYRAYSKDAEYAENAQRAASHYQAAATALGAKTQMDLATSV